MSREVRRGQTAGGLAKAEGTRGGGEGEGEE
jgi:hypothetical protein